MKTKIILIFWLQLFFIFPSLLVGQSEEEYKNEGKTYPTRSNFFKGIPVEKNSKIAFQDEKNSSNTMIFNYAYNKLSDYMVAVPGLNQSANTTSPQAIKLKANATSTASFTNNNATTITSKGFAIAFWTKWPYTSSELTTNVMKVINEDDATLWETGTTYDRRVYVKRQTNNTVGFTEADMHRAPRFWNLKFWNPEKADIDKTVADSKNGLEWYFVMIVQEKTQIRLHMGMPNGVFDCMYLNYGLEDQHAFLNAVTRNLSFFGNNEEFYFQDLSIWDLPLCREEAFEYYKDSRGITGSTFRLNNSSIKSTVINDDKARMIRDAQRTGCITSSNKTAAKGINLIKEINEEDTLDIQESLEKESLEKVILFPNPTRSEINIKIPSAIIKSNNSPVNLILIDLLGRVLRSSKLNLEPDSNTIRWRIPQSESLPNGIYVLKLNISGKIFSGRIAIDCGCN